MNIGGRATPPDDYELMSFLGTLGEYVDDNESIVRYVVEREGEALSIEIYATGGTVDVLWNQQDETSMYRHGTFRSIRVDKDVTPEELVVSLVGDSDSEELRIRIRPQISMHAISTDEAPIPTPIPKPIPPPSFGPDVLEQVLALENEFLYDGKPTLDGAYALLLDRWDMGDHDREVGLHLLFLSWHRCAVAHAMQEPQEALPRDSGVFGRVEAQLSSLLPYDDELTFVVGMMMAANPRCCGLTIFEIEALVPSEPTVPATIQRETFEDRGYYGYFFTRFTFGEEPDHPSPMLGGNVAGYADALGNILSSIAQNLRF